jgi:hypothetical protein
VSVAWSLAYGSAAVGSDVASVSGTVTWADGDTANKTITVPVTSADGSEAPEVCFLALALPGNGWTAKPRIPLVITDPSASPLPSPFVGATLGRATTISGGHAGEAWIVAGSGALGRTADAGQAVLRPAAIQDACQVDILDLRGQPSATCAVAWRADATPGAATCALVLNGSGTLSLVTRPSAGASATTTLLPVSGVSSIDRLGLLRDGATITAVIGRGGDLGMEEVATRQQTVAGSVTGQIGVIVGVGTAPTDAWAEAVVRLGGDLGGDG